MSHLKQTLSFSHKKRVSSYRQLGINEDSSFHKLHDVKSSPNHRGVSAQAKDFRNRDLCMLTKSLKHLTKHPPLSVTMITWPKNTTLQVKDLIFFFWLPETLYQQREQIARASQEASSSKRSVSWSSPSRQRSETSDSIARVRTARGGGKSKIR